jgi:hypothetical protein
MLGFMNCVADFLKAGELCTNGASVNFIPKRTGSGVVARSAFSLGDREEATKSSETEEKRNKWKV